MEIYNATNNSLVEGSNNDDFIENVAQFVTILAYNGDDTVEHNFNNSSSLAKVYINGGKGNDLIAGDNPRYYDSTIYGGEGNDSILATTKSAAGTRNTFFTGDDGNDFIQVRGNGNNPKFANTIQGGAGNDTIIDSYEYASISGGEGNDRIEIDSLFGGTVDGGAGNDTIRAYTNHYAATLNGGAGDDVISVSGGGNGSGGPSYNYNYIVSGAGNDSVFSNATYFEITSGDGNDYIVLESGGNYNTILSGAGNDTIRLSSMNNIVNYGAGTGNDIIFGFNTSDTLKLAESKIVSIGTLGDDVIICTGEKDSLTIKDGADRNLNLLLSNGKSMSTVISDSILRLNGTSNADSIRNFLDSVTVDAGAGNDTVTNIGDNVSINAGAGNDFISSSGSKVTISGGAGNDSVSISGGAFYQYSGGKDTVNGFSASDTIHVASGSISSTSVSGSDVIFSIGSGSLTLKKAKNVSFKLKIGNGSAVSTVIGSSSGGGDTQSGGESSDGTSIKGDTLTVTKNFTGNSIDLANYSTKVTKVNASALSKALIILGSKVANSISSGTGNDIVYGGAGNDTLLGNSGNDILYGDAGNDNISGEAGADTIYAGKGNDTLTGGAGKDIFVYEGGNDLISDYKTGEDKIKLASGSISSASVSGSNVVLKIGSGNVTVKGAKDKKITVIDSSGKETSSVYPLDTMPAGLSYDSSKKVLTVGTSYGGAAIDLANYATTTKTVDASSFSKKIKITGNNLGDSIIGGKGADTLTGGSKVDTIEGGAGNDKIYGEAGNDKLWGDAGNDTIYGGAGNDSVYGGAGTDKLFGDAGNDTLSGGAGNDTLTGGAGNDIFVYGTGEGKDVITDYAAGDKIKISSGSIKSTSYSGSNVIFAVGSGTLTVQNGKGKKITIVDANNKTTTQTYSGAVSGTSKLFADDNFIGGETRLDDISKITAENYSVGKISATDYQKIAQDETFIAYAEK